MEYSVLARGKKRSRSLFELMNPEGDYRAPVGTGKVAPKPAEQPKGKKTAEKKSAEKPAVKKEPKKKAEKEYATEPLLAAGEGKIRLVLNYPLAVMVCFMVLVAVICAVLVGWKLGRDWTYRKLLLGQQERIERKIPGMELEDPADSIDE